MSAYTAGETYSVDVYDKQGFHSSGEGTSGEEDR